MNAVSKLVEVAEKECRTHGVPITRKRVNIFSALLSLQKAVSAYELADSYEQLFSEPVPVITVYRVLEFLQRKSLVHKLEIANKFVVCTQFECAHSHPASQFLICNQCLKVKELGMSVAKFDELNQTIEQAGFYLDTSQLEMNCICSACHTGAK